MKTVPTSTLPKTKLIIIFLSFFLFNSLFLPPSAQAQSSWSSNCYQQGDVATIQGVECVFGNVLRIILTLIGIASFLMIVIAAFQYLTSAGDAKKTEVARSTLTFAVIGVGLAIICWFALQFIAGFTLTRPSDLLFFRFQTIQ